MLALKYSEPVLKARHARGRMESILVGNIRRALDSAGTGKVPIRKESGVIFVEAGGEEKLVPVLQRIFAIDTILIAKRVPLDESTIFAECVEAAKGFKPKSSFAVRARRAWKHGRSSQELAAMCGGAIFDAFPRKGLTVDLGSPDNEVFVEIRRDAALISRSMTKGFGGLPVGCEGNAVCIIDSANSLLAAWLMAKRGMMPVLLVSGRHPTSALEGWLPGLNTERHPTDETGKRALLESACSLAEQVGANCVVTGDMFNDISGKGALSSLDSGLPLPVFRPLAGFDGKMLAGYLSIFKSGAPKK